MKGLLDSWAPRIPAGVLHQTSAVRGSEDLLICDIRCHTQGVGWVETLIAAINVNHGEAMAKPW